MLVFTHLPNVMMTNTVLRMICSIVFALSLLLNMTHWLLYIEVET